MSCYALFPGDADIDGTGVYIAFFVPGVVTAVAMVVHVSVPLTRFRDSFESWRFAEAPERYSRRPDFSLLHPGRIWLHYFTSYLLSSLGDLQCITGLGIVVAGIVQLNTASFYHLVMIQNYWNITFIAMWTVEILISDRLERLPPTAGEGDPRASRPRGVFENMLNRRSLGRVWRKVFNRELAGDVLMISGLISTIYYQSSAFQRMNSEWNEVTPGHCYRDADHFSDASFYFWIIGLGSFALEKILCLHPTLKSCLRAVYHWFELQERRLVSTSRCLRERLDDSPFAKSPLRWLAHLVCLCLSLTALITFWALRQFLALWAVGNGARPFLTAVYLGFFLWSIYDVLEVPFVNRDLIQTDRKWGFGQVLPLVLMLSLIIFAIDANAAASKRCSEIRRLAAQDDACDGDSDSDSEAVEAFSDASQSPLMSSSVDVVHGKVFAKPYFGLDLFHAAEDYARGVHRVTKVHALWYSTTNSDRERRLAYNCVC